jgi:uncharacterized protein YkwD
MRRYQILFTLFFLSLIFTFTNVSKAAPHASYPQSPGELIALINAYRAEYGLPAYTQNSILMGTAQGQADYQASIQSVTHEGPDGGRPRDRAYAAGYGNGEIVFISEIIYGGTTSGPETAVNWWKTSQIHNDTMLASTYQEIGAGVASANGRNYYTAVTGYIAGGVYVAPSADSASEEEQILEPAPIIIPVIVATPQNDGSITHTIQTGQTLWTVAAVYEISLSALLSLNNLPENAVIFPGDEILIAKFSNLVANPTLTPTLDLAPTPSSTPTQIDQSNSPDNNLPTENLDSADLPAEEIDASGSSIQLTIFIALGTIMAVTLASFFVRGKPQGLPKKKE